MSLKIDKVQLDIIINNDQSRKQLRELDDEARKLQKELKKLPAGTKEWIEKSNELKKVQSQYEAVKKEIGLTGLTLKELRANQKELNMVMANMNPKLPQYKILQTELQQTNARIKELSTGAKASGSSLSSLASGMNKYWMVITTGVATLTGVVLGFKKLVEDFGAFEQKVANLSAITGLAGDDLKYLSDTAKELSVSTTAAGVRITASADDIVDGFKLMGSARPELLKDKEALAKVTEGALTLAAAAQMEMTPAVDAVAAAMNQFGLGANETNRIINVLGAGALAGSAEIPQLTEALGTCGTVAQNSNLTLEQTIGVMETLAERQLKGTEAGTQFKSSLISMKAAGLGYSSGMFNMRDALVELKAKMDSANGAMERDKVLIDVFGKRNITVGTILTQNIERYDYFAKAVTGTNVAVEQAITSTDTHAAKLAQAKNKAHLMALELGEKLAPAMVFSTNAFMYFLKAIMISIEFFNKHRVAILSVVAGVSAYAVASKIAAQWDTIHYYALEVKRIALKALGYATKILTGEIKIATIVQKAWNFATSVGAGGIAAIIGIVATAVTALVLYKQKLSDAELAQQALNDASAEAERRMVTENYQRTQLVKLAKDETQSKEDRLAAIKKLNAISPEYLGNITLETINTKEATQALTDYIAELERKNKVEILQEKIKEEQGKQIDIQNSKLDDNINGWEKAWNVVKNTGNAAGITMSNVKTALDNQAESLTDSKNLVSAYEKELQKLSKASDILKSDGTAPPIVEPPEPPENIDKLKDAYERLNEKITEYKKLQLALLAEGKTSEAAWYGAKIRNLEKEKQGYDDIAAAMAEYPTKIEPIKAAEAELVDIDIKRTQQVLDNIDLTVEAEKLAAAKKIELDEKVKDAKLSAEKELISTVSELWKTSINKRFDDDMRDLEASKEIELSNKKLTDAQKLSIEKKYKAQELKLKQEQAKDEKLVNAGKITADTALAIMKTIAELGGVGALTPAGIALIAAMTSMGVMQAAVVMAQPIPQYKIGGPTPSGSDDKVVGVVHANEYVIPAWQRRMPQVMAMESILESIRVNRGFAVGGATSSNTITNNNTQSMFTDPRLVSALEKFNKHLDSGLKANVLYTDIEEAKTKVDETRTRFNG